MVVVVAGTGTFGTDVGLMKGLATRPLLVTALEDHVCQGALIVVCGEPGMGKNDALEIAGVVGEQYGAHVHTIDLSNCALSYTCERMARATRSLLRRLVQNAWAVVRVRGIPSLDERGVHRMCASIARLREAGCCVVLALRPEAIQLAEACPDSFTVWSDELCVESPKGLCAHATEEFHRLTCCVPVLARALVPIERDGRYEFRIGREYHDALCSVIKLALRDTLISDERRIRLSMLLLGSGTFVQLGEVVGSLDPELLQDICRHAPLFGVDMAQGMFACAGLCRDEWLQACVFALREVCGKNPMLCSRAARLLLLDGRYERAASVLELCGRHEDADELAIQWCLELVNEGKTDIVRRALPRVIQLRRCTPQLRRACQTLLKLMDNARLGADDIALDPLTIAIDRERDEVLRILILLASRLVWQGRSTKIPVEATALTDALARDLMLHLSATHALVEGRGHAAYHLLVCGSPLTGKETLAGQLLDADLAFAHLLMGLPCPARSPVAKRCDLGGACMLCYLPAVPALDAVWRSGAAVCAIDKLDLFAGQVGDDLILVHFLLAGALANARCGAVSHAIVKCNRALAAAERLGASYLADAARVVCWAVRINAGDMPSAEEFAGNEPVNAGMRALSAVLSLVAEGKHEVIPSLLDVTLDRDVTWMASALLTGLARLSPLLEQIMPPTWLVIIEGMHARDEDTVSDPPLAQLSEDLYESCKHEIYVRLFGGIEVYVNGERVPSGMLEQRRAKSLVTYACAVSPRKLRRADLIDAIWPECDYEQGAQRIYAATNVINRAIRAHDTECSFFAPRGSDHVLALNEACVSSDVSEFERLAHQALESEGNDDEVLSLVRGVQGLYRGDLYVPAGETGRAIDRRRLVLRGLFTDVLVAGAEAALRRGSPRLAAHLCEQALLADETREDANACLVKALDSCGRSIEARERSKAFAARLGAMRRERPNRENT